MLAKRSPSKQLSAGHRDQLGKKIEHWALRFFGNGSPRTMTFVSRREYLNATIYEFCVDPIQDVIVKIPYPESKGPAYNKSSARTSVEPILPPPDESGKSAYEFAALESIEKNIVSSDPDRFAAVRPLALFNEPQALLMSKCVGPLLADFPDLQSGPPSPRTLAIAGDAGAWLSRFHDLEDLPHTKTRSSTRAEFLDRTESYFARLAESDTDGFDPRWLLRFKEAALDLLPDDLPCGLNHGDFTPSNIIVTEHDRPAVFDTHARWRAPRYEDIAKFLFMLRSSTKGRQARTNSDLERAFLGGYSTEHAGGIVPRSAVRLFEIQRVLERWALFCDRFEAASGLKKQLKKVRFKTSALQFAPFVEDSLQTIERGAED